MTQPGFIFCRDSHVTEPADLRRLSGQNLAIMERLQRGPATNRELAQLSLKYTSRISDLRANGNDILADRKQGGLTVYRLVTL